MSEPIQPSMKPKRSPIQPVRHFVILCIASLGVYEAYWFYKNWKFLKKLDNLKISPFWRAVFAPFFIFSLFKRILALAIDKGYKENPNSSWAAIGYIAICLCYRLPDPFWMVSIFAFIPLIPVLKALNFYWKAENPGLEERTKFSGGEIALIIIGGIVLILAIIGTFLPDETASACQKFIR